MSNLKKTIQFLTAFVLGFAVLVLFLAKKNYLINDIKYKANQHSVRYNNHLLYIQEKLNKTKTIKMKVRVGDTLTLVLQRAGIGFTEAKSIAKSLETVFNINSLRPFNPQSRGDIINLDLKKIPESERLHKDIIWSVNKMYIIRSPLEEIMTINTPSGFISKLEKKQEKIKYVYKLGKIKEEQSFIYSATKEGIPYDVIDRFYDVLSFDIDFERDIYPNDSYAVLYEEKYTPDNEFIEVGALLYAELHIHGKNLSLYRFTKDNGRTAFYDENGKGASKTLKKTPINGARISSTYGYRKHPILGFNKFHKGVDFAAPKGTPIPAAGDGIIEYRGWNNGGYGNMVRIRHNATYSTLYAHLSAFKLSAGIGTRVKQGDIIGFVGSTGMSTGPHLHYEIRKNGKSVNPIYVSLPSTDILEGKNLESFKIEVDNIKNIIKSKDLK